MVHVQGLVYAGRGSLTDEKSEFARTGKEGSRMKGIKLPEAIQSIKPTALIGATAKRGTVSEEALRMLAKVCICALLR